MPQLMRTSNPALNDQAFQGAGVAIGEPMTLQGTVNKTGVLLLCVIATAAWTWNIFMHTHSQESAMSLAMVGGIGGFIVALVTIFKKTWAPVTAPIYALLEGLVLGGISAMFELRFPGIAIQAVSLTFGTLAVLLLVYRSGVIPVTENFKLGVVAATGGIALFYLATMVLGFFGVHLTTINGSGPIGIGFSIFVVIIAALNLVLDFDFIENAVRAGAPKYMEWYAAFGLMVTLIWLYFEILRLLSKLRSRN
ncbi:MAG TPA: Bax inhibitor-1/YccA family protein [Candidatus Binatus sp.]|nr:Bax inhibitor-1/YccA family protein [Candidatus Binatus sp.]